MFLKDILNEFSFYFVTKKPDTQKKLNAKSETLDRN